jgi:hypothetical protein
LQTCIDYGTALHSQGCVNQTSDLRRSPLMLAWFAGATSLLLSAGANFNWENEDHETVLMHCLSDHWGKSLPIVLNYPRLCRTFRRKPMVKILRELQTWETVAHFQQIIDGQICCSDLTSRGWKRLRNLGERPLNPTPEHISSIQELWAEVLSGIK